MGRHEISPTEQPDSKVGTIGWAILGAGVIAWDVLAPETLSGAVDRALEHPHARVAAVAGVLTTGAHLLNLIPEQVDPFVQAFNLLDRIRSVTAE